MALVVSRMVATVHQFTPAAVTTPTRLPYASMAQLPMDTPAEVPLLRVTVLDQLLTDRSATRAETSSRSRRWLCRSSRFRSRWFSSMSFWAPRS